jgi:hypothetical protein
MLARPSILRNRQWRRVTALAVLTVVGHALTPTASAGGGAENLFLLVNSRSESSRAIANHYIHLRKIPPMNVLSIDWAGGRENTPVARFRDQLLSPALGAITERNLGQQIDYLIYSSDFPWRILLQKDYPEEPFPKSFSPFASINGATYLAPYVLQKNPAVVMPHVNWYAPKLEANQVFCTQLVDTPSRGFRGRYGWQAGGVRTQDPKQGQHYLLSTMLGVTTGRGNHVHEVLAYLQRSVSADGKQPQGTFYFMRMADKDVRSKTRHDCYPAAVAKLEALGARATVMNGVLPDGRRDILGLMTGAASFDVNSAGIQILPGAICDHLTSYGGDLRAGASQTPLTDFLRLGAAGASGTVIEPTAQQAKFPLPSIHIHYRRGCSLAESFYQSVMGPYQLLIVGDPLCQPWATPPKVEVNVRPDQVVKGQLDVTPRVTPAAGKPVGPCEIFLDGRLIAARVPAGQTLALDTTKMPDGSHELRVVAANADPIESQGRVIVPFTVDNHGRQLELTVTPSGKVTRLDRLTIKARSSGSASIRILAYDRELGRIDGETGEIVLSAGEIGPGPVRLRAEAAGTDGAVMAVSAAVSLAIE